MQTSFLSLCLTATAALFLSCGNAQKSTAEGESLHPVGPAFVADSAYNYCEKQCAFGPRTMNSAAHETCGQWIAAQFAAFGMAVELQKATLHGYNGTALASTNIIARHRPEAKDRLLICAHWDSRPWADNDPDPDNWRTPVMAANDGASGVAVMLELARLLHQADSAKVGVDFVCFDAEDWGTPQWDESSTGQDAWALGAQHWADEAQKAGYKPHFGILVDMVGGQGAHFYQELYSRQYAPEVVARVWNAARIVGFGSYFPQEDGGMITDDHVPVNERAGIPCIDIIPYYPDCEQSNFGPTWHTVSDDMEHIDRATLQAVGQTLLQVVYSWK